DGRRGVESRSGAGQCGGPVPFERTGEIGAQRPAAGPGGGRGPLLLTPRQNVPARKPLIGRHPTALSLAAILGSTPHRASAFCALCVTRAPSRTGGAATRISVAWPKMRA